LGHIAKALVTKEKKREFLRQAARALAPVNIHAAAIRQEELATSDCTRRQ
jgi:hypothetical protein